MSYLIPRSLGLPEEPTPSMQNLSADGIPRISSAGAIYSTLLQLRAHVETGELERTVLKQLVQRLQRDFALLQPQLESIDQPTTSKSSSLEIKIKTLEKRLSSETCRNNSRLNSLQHQLSTMGNQIFRLERSSSKSVS